MDLFMLSLFIDVGKISTLISKLYITLKEGLI